MGQARRPRILFVGEAVTLAHVSRPIALAQALDPARHEAILAVEPRFRSLWEGLPFEVRSIRSIPREQFLAALAKGRPVYDVETLRGYVREDRELIREVAPDAIVGDFRLSLSVSARLEGVPYLAITNAYWSPHARPRFPLPELRPLTTLLPIPVAKGVFDLVRPLAFASHSAPLNRVREENGLPPLGRDLRRIYTDADHVLYADTPELAPIEDAPANHHYLGPILWSPPIDLPGWWGELPDDRPIVYVNLGSSGRGSLLGRALAALADLPVSVVAASVDGGQAGRSVGNAWLAPFLPGREAAARSRLVVCNGGSPSVHQALSVGTPAIGLAENMDQHLNMEPVHRLGAGLLLRSDRATPRAIRAAASRVLDDPSFARAARGVSESIARYPYAERFRAVLGGVLAR
jgi:UDP:flavonoid glycosyltransferase YjiC (YdhE family)